MAVIYKGRVLGTRGCCGGYMCRLKNNRLAVMATVISYDGYKIRLRVALVATGFSYGQAEC